MALRPHSRYELRIAIICALSLEAELIDAIFDIYWAREGLDLGKAPGDQNVYTLGAIGRHNVVLAHMPGMGGNSAASVSAGLRSSFPQIEIAFVAGICGASPYHPETGDEIILGDCVLSTALIQYDFGRQYSGQFQRKIATEDVAGRANPAIRSLLNQLQIPRVCEDLTASLTTHLGALRSKSPKAEYPGRSKDQLFKSNYAHGHHDGIICEDCSFGVCTKSCQALGCLETVERKRLIDFPTQQTRIHFGRYGSANTVMKSSNDRDRLTREDKIAAFEMEGAGVWDNLPTIIVKSACDYADGHKNKVWQAYAAATSAAAVKAILNYWSSTGTNTAARIAINVPDYAVAQFIPRIDIQAQVESWLLNDQQERLVLRGMGGVGKSQLALACCKLAVKRCFGTVLWIDASSIFSVEQSLRRIVSDLKESPNSNVDKNLRILAGCITQRRGPWLAVFDNFDTPGAFKGRLITKFVPKVEHGKVLFTSRDGASERLGKTIRISGMTEDQSLELLLKRPTSPKERNIGVQICAELGYLALALDQAGAYIQARNLRLEKFIPHLRQRKKVILEEIPEHWEYRKPGKEQDVLLNAFTTWELSFDQLKGSRKTKMFKERFLTLCAFFDAASVSKEYFEVYSRKQKPWLAIFQKAGGWDDFLFDDLVAECCKLSLLQFSSSSDSLSIHPLVRDWLKLRKSSQEKQNFAEEFTDILIGYESSLEVVYKCLAVKQRLAANVTSCMQEDIRFRNISNDDLKTAVNFFHIYNKCGFYDEAKTLANILYTKLVERRNRTTIPGDHIATSIDLAHVCMHTDRLNEAEKLWKQAISSTPKGYRFSEQDEKIMDMMQYLILLHIKQGRYGCAAGSCTDILPASKLHEIKGNIRFPLVIAACINYFHEDDFEAAEDLLRDTLESIEETSEAASYFRTLITYYLACALWPNGSLDETETLLRSALEAFTELEGDKSASTVEIKKQLKELLVQKAILTTSQASDSDQVPALSTAKYQEQKKSTMLKLLGHFESRKRDSFPTRPPDLEAIEQRRRERLQRLEIELDRPTLTGFMVQLVVPALYWFLYNFVYARIYMNDS